MTPFKRSSLAQAVAICAGALLFAGSATAADTKGDKATSTRQGVGQGRLRHRQEGLRRPGRQRQGHLRRRGQGQAHADRGERRGGLQEHRPRRVSTAAHEIAGGRLQGREGALRRQGRHTTRTSASRKAEAAMTKVRPTPRPPRRAPKPAWTPTRTSATPITRSRRRSATRCRAMSRARASLTPRRTYGK